MNRIRIVADSSCDLITLDAVSYTHLSFCVTLLAHDAPAALINDFGYRSGRVADKFSPYEVRREMCIRDSTGAVETAMKSGDKVQMVGFGSFEVKKRPARVGRNPRCV